MYILPSILVSKVATTTRPKVSVVIFVFACFMLLTVSVGTVLFVADAPSDLLINN